MSERNEISIHEVRVYRVLREAKEWLTSGEIAKRANVSPRTETQSRPRCHAMTRAERDALRELCVSVMSTDLGSRKNDYAAWCEREPGEAVAILIAFFGSMSHSIVTSRAHPIGMITRRIPSSGSMQL